MGTPVHVPPALVQATLAGLAPIARARDWQGGRFGLPIGSPFRGRVPQNSPLLFGGK
jgi:hypothetical protein